jgi:hypothetical protein
MSPSGSTPAGTPISDAAASTTPPPPAAPTPNPYVSVPAPPPPAPSVHGFVSLQTVNKQVNVNPAPTTAPTPGDAGMANGQPLSTWNVPNLTTTAYVRLNNQHIMKVRNIAYYNLYGYFVDSSGNQISAPFTTTTSFPSFEIGNFYP